MTLVLRDIVLPLPHFTLQVTVEMSRQSTALCGPSGAGKTSIIELIAGLRHPSAGRMMLNGAVLFDKEAGINVPPGGRSVGYVPQDDTLFPHLSVRQNVMYGAARATHDGFALDRVAAAVEIEHLLGRGVHHLSGGERKRVALARALVSAPQILLLDEPLAGIDSELGGRLLEYLIRIRNEFPIPMIYVTHQLEEAAAVCEEAILLNRGTVVSQGPIALKLPAAPPV